MKFSFSSVKARKNFAILSLVLMLGVISYVNYSLNQQALLGTSSELEEYELTMMEESGMVNDLLEEEKVFNEGGEMIVENGDDLNSNEISLLEKDLEDVNIVKSENEEVENEKINNAVIVDSMDTNKVTDLAEETNSEIAETVTSDKLLSSSNYFIEGKLERDKKRSEMVSNLDDIINSQNTSDEIKTQAENMKLSTIENTEKEVFIENMITAKGFNDTIVYLNDESINVIVSSENLTENDVAKIVDIVQRETDVNIDNITIMNKK